MEVTNPYASKKSTENSNNGCSTTPQPISDVINNDSAANYEIEFAHQQTVMKRIIDDRSNRLNSKNSNLVEGKTNNDEDEIRMLRNYGSLISSHASMVGMLQSNIHRASTSDNNKNRNGDGKESVNSLKALLDYHYSTHNQHYEKLFGPYSDDDDDDDSNKNCNTKKTSFLLGDSQLLCSAFENQLSFYKTIHNSDDDKGDIDSLIDIDADVDEFFSAFPEYNTKISKKQQNNEDDDNKDEPEVQVLGTGVTIDVDDDDNCNNKKASSLQQHKRDIENKYYEPSQSQTTSKKKKKKSKHPSSSTTSSSVNNSNQINNSSSSTKNKNPYAKQKRNDKTAPTIPESMSNNVNTSQQESSTHSGWNAYTQNPPPHFNMQQNMNPYQSNINPNNNNVMQNSFIKQPQHPPSNQGISNNPNNMAYSASSKNPAINSFQTAKDLYDGGALNNEATPQNQNRPYQPNEQYRSYNDRYPDHQRQGNPNTNNNMNSYNHGYNSNNFPQNTNGFSNPYSNNNYDQSFQPNQVNMNPYHQQPEQPQQGLRSPNIASSLKRKFKPPKRQVVTNNQNKRTNTNTSTGNAGPKANNTNNNSFNSNKNNNKSKDDDEELPEELQHLDKELVKKIEQDILDNGESIIFDDIAGLENAKQTVQELVIWPMQRPDLFTGLRKGPNGLLLFGPPGTGKTLIGKAVAHESGATFFAISSSSLTSKWIGEGEKMVKTLFAVARYRSPSVVFMDEVDSLLTQRKADENEASRRIKTEFLVQLDGTASNAKKGDETGTPKSEMVLVIGATNLPHELDDAARRRFVKRIYIPLPEKADREVLIRTLMKKNVHSMSDKDFKKLSGDMTAGFSGADLKALCTDAALGPLRQLGKRALSISADDVPPISYKHFRSSVKGMNKSVSKSDLDIYIKWDSEYGSKISKEDDNEQSSSSDSESDDDE